MVSATHRKMDQPPKARPGAVMTPRWSAAGRMCPPIEGTAHRKVRSIRAPRGAPSLRRVRRKEGEDGVTRAAKNRAGAALAASLPGCLKKLNTGKYAGRLASTLPLAGEGGKKSYSRSSRASSAEVSQRLPPIFWTSA